MAFIGHDQLVTETLVVALAEVMLNELLNCFPQLTFTEKDHPVQVGFLDVAHKSLGVGIQVQLARAIVAAAGTAPSDRHSTHDTGMRVNGKAFLQSNSMSLIPPETTRRLHLREPEMLKESPTAPK